jgi:zinc transport system ATP-binding protein
VTDLGVVIAGHTILKDINLHIHCGDLSAIIGPNGAGKSTLLKAILGQINHTGTMQFLDAKNCRTGNPLVRYIPQNLAFDKGSPVSVLDFLIACKTSYPVWLKVPIRLTAKMKANLEVTKSEHLLNRRLGALSGGELQRVLLAMALDPVPDLLLLDEPTSGIDVNGIKLIFETVSRIRKNYDLSIILVSHDLGWISDYADHVVLLNQTVRIQGTPLEVYKSQEFREVFGL